MKNNQKPFKNNRLERLFKTINDIDQELSILPDIAESISLEEKNKLFQEFESLNQNIVSITSWLNAEYKFTFLQKNKADRFLISFEEDSLVIKCVNKPKLPHF